jgi:hypothetical protein
MIRSLAIRYAAAGLVSFVTYIAACFAYALIDGSCATSLAFVRFGGFLVVAAGAFCFPLASRPFRSLVLLSLGLLAYCSTDLLRDDYFLERHPFPCFASLLIGGFFAIPFHCLIYLLWTGFGWLTRALQRLTAAPLGSRAV